jgi:hypothetical protein
MFELRNYFSHIEEDEDTEISFFMNYLSFLCDPCVLRVFFSVPLCLW